jgi:NADH:ubiquinone oxidoreductase subunit 3 (subunit A)
MNPNNLLAPPFAFAIYLALVGLIAFAARKLSARSRETAFKTGAYASGEAAPLAAGVPGYHRFFVIALFFAVLHLGVLMLATGGLSWLAGIYLLGLLLALVALILG